MTPFSVPTIISDSYSKPDLYFDVFITIERGTENRARASPVPNPMSCALQARCRAVQVVKT